MNTTALQTLPLETDDTLGEYPTPQQAIRAQRERGFLNLRFDGELECAFRSYLRVSGRVPRLAMALLALFLLVLMPVYMQFLQPPAAFLPYALWLQYAQVPAVLVAGAVVWFRPDSPWTDRLCIVAFVIMAASILIRRVIGQAYGFDVPLVFLGIAATGLVVLSRTRFWYTLPWMLLATVAMLLVEWRLVQPQAGGYYQLIATLILLLLACVGGYSIEYLIRETWINSSLLQYVSYRDGLTNLLNRKALENEIDSILAVSRRERRAFGVAMIDIDYFKTYNDANGHGEGDTIIRHVSALLRAAARRPQDCCGRYGGDEFVLVWVDGEYDESCALAERLCRRIEQAHIPHAGSLVSKWVTASVGLYWVAPGSVAAAPGAADKAVARLLDAADERLYKAKADGRNRVVSARSDPSS